jgi:hypothetical protein
VPAYGRCWRLTLGSDPGLERRGAHRPANMGKKSASDAIVEPASNGDAQRSMDLVIAPEKKTPKLDTSKWPLLLKVGDALRNGRKVYLNA